MLYVLVFFVMVAGEPSPLWMSPTAYAGAAECQEAMDFADFGEPYGSLKGEHPDMQMACWPVDGGGIKA